MQATSLQAGRSATFGFLARFLKDTLLLLRQNLKEVAAFIIICSIASLVLTSVLTSVTISILMMISGTPYIVPANLAQTMLKPPALWVLAIEQVLAALIALFQIAGLLHAFSMSQIGLGTNMSSMFSAGLRVCRKTLHPKNWPIVPFILVLLPLSNVMPLASTPYKLIVPGFVSQTIEYTPLYRNLNSFVYLAILLIVLMFIFAINIYSLRDDGFVQSCRMSVRLMKHRYLRTVLALSVLIVLLHITINTVAPAISVNVSELMAFLGTDNGIITRSSNVGIATVALRQLLEGLLVPVFNNAGLTALFYRYIDESELLSSLSPSTFETHGLSHRTRTVAICLVTATAIGASVYLVHDNAYLAAPVDRPIVCAHRGDNVNAPENTMPAFGLAFSENLEWIELDVHQTSDGIIVCSHDASIGRVTGHNLLIREHTYAELSQYPMGDWMPGDYKDVTIPTLEEVLTKAHESGVNVQVELKGSAGDVDFEEHVLEVIDSCGIHDNVMVICQDANRMMRVAELDPTITKGYCMFVAQGKLEEIPYTDNVSIEESNVTPQLVKRLHEHGVKVFCWTVDRQDTVQYLVSCDVDVIGTDNPLLINDALERVDYSGGPVRFCYVIMHQVANMPR